MSGMSVRLRPCEECRRHVRAVERACPFCGAAMPIAAPTARPLLGLVIGAGAAIAISGCDVTSVASAQQDEDEEPIRLTPQYGAPDYYPPPPPTTQSPVNQDAGVPPPPRGRRRLPHGY